MSVGPAGPTEKVLFVKFSLPVNFVVPLEKLTGPDPRHPKDGSGSATLLVTGAYILENTPPWGGGYQPMSFGGKNMKSRREKGENVKEKGRKGNEKGRKGKENEKRGSKKVK